MQKSEATASDAQPTVRCLTRQELSHDKLGDEFERALSNYDTRRRVEVLVDDFLTDDMLRGKRVVDVGCGLGYFSERLVQRGADVVACDVGESLLERTRRRARCEVKFADVMRLTDFFPPETVDGIVSSECIEHVPDPAQAVREMSLAVKPGGFLALSTPNIVWQPVVRTATRLKLRPFDGHENFSSWRQLRRTLRDCGMEIRSEAGLHLFPFQLPFHGLSRWCDRHLQRLRGLMINICLLAVKRQT